MKPTKETAVPNAEGHYTGAEKRDYPQPRCPKCGAPARQEWANAGSIADSDLWLLGRISCPKAKDHPREG